MFEDSLFATNAKPARRRGMATVVSFGLQAVILGVLVLVPLIYTDAVPLGNLKSWVEIPLPPGPRQPPPPQPPHHRPRQPIASNYDGMTLLQPNRIPDRVNNDPEPVSPVPTGPYVPDTAGPTGNGSHIFDSILASNMRPAPPPPPTPSVRHTVPVSGGVIEGLLIHKITPIYPALARQMRLQGRVVIQATIDRDGTIQHLQVISGHPMLVPAAMDAVKQWRYRPYLLNHEPVDVETQITVNFTLGG